MAKLILPVETRFELPGGMVRCRFPDGSVRTVTRGELRDHDASLKALNPTKPDREIKWLDEDDEPAPKKTKADYDEVKPVVTEPTKEKAPPPEPMPKPDMACKKCRKRGGVVMIDGGPTHSCSKCENDFEVVEGLGVIGAGPTTQQGTPVLDAGGKQIQKSRSQYTPEQRKALVKEIAARIAAGVQAVEAACEELKVGSTQNYYNWRRVFPDAHKAGVDEGAKRRKSSVTEKEAAFFEAPGNEDAEVVEKAVKEADAATAREFADHETIHTTDACGHNGCLSTQFKATQFEGKTHRECVKCNWLHPLEVPVSGPTTDAAFKKEMRAGMKALLERAAASVSGGKKEKLLAKSALARDGLAGLLELLNELHDEIEGL